MISVVFFLTSRREHSCPTVLLQTPSVGAKVVTPPQLSLGMKQLALAKGTNQMLESAKLPFTLVMAKTTTMVSILVSVRLFLPISKRKWF